MFSTAYWDAVTPTLTLNADTLNGKPASEYLTVAQVNQRNVLEVSTGSTAGTQTLTCSTDHLNKLLVWTPATSLSGIYQLTTAPFSTAGVYPEIEIYNNSTTQAILVQPPTTTPASTILSQWGYRRIAPQGTAVIKFRRNNAGSYEFLLVGALTNLNL